MRIFVAGATGVIGRRLVPLLLEAGHEVTGMSRDERRAAGLRAGGAEAVVCDALDADGLTRAVVAARPEIVVHELTALPKAINPRTMRRDFALNDRLRSEGTRNLVAAARAAGARRVVAQSIAFAYAPRPGGPHGRDDPLWLDAPGPAGRTLRAVAALEDAVTATAGTVLRYGYFYGPGSALAHDGSLAAQVRARRFPVVGAGDGVWSFVHVDDAAAATLAACESDVTGTWNIVDDDPARVGDWIPAYAAALGARPPHRVPGFLARAVAGPYALHTMAGMAGASNALMKAELGWRPRIESWRRGFVEALG